jgi:hypothetical protein
MALSDGKYHLDESDVATILAALRLYQVIYESYDEIDLANTYPEHFDGGRIQPLTADDIEELCERINVARTLVCPTTQS